MLEFKYQDKYDKEYLKLKKKLHSIYLARLIIGIFTIISFICYFTLNLNIIYLISALLGIAIFMFVVIYFNKDYIEAKNYENIKLEYLKHEARRDNKFNSKVGFFDKGKNFKKKYSKLSLRNKYLLEDIDVFGDNSLYQNLNQAKSVLGRERFASSLVDGKSRYLEKEKDNFASKCYSLGKDERLILIDAAIDFNKVEEDLDYDSYLKTLNSKYNKSLKDIFLIMIISIIDIIFLTISLILKNYLLLIFIPIINIFYSFTKKDPLLALNPTKIFNSLENYQYVLKYLSKIDLSDLINEDNLKIYYKDIKKTKFLWQSVSYKQNFLYKILINLVLPFEALFELYFDYRLPKVGNLDKCFNTVAYLEELASFANVACDYEACIGVVSDKLSFKDLSNILVKNCVSNDFTYEKGVILTGSNMSGKTTFMRSIAINLLLFNANAPVCATSFSSPLYKVYTSLRIKDELSLGVSTFYAEIEKIKEIVNEDDRPKLCLIDEIFKGTNTLDRVYGAKKLIEKLQNINHDFIISTHDFELCSVPTIINYHFEEIYNEDYSQISFDYKLKEGPSHSTNAIFLLKSSNIID